MKYIALLRGVNVGGKNRVPMVDLKVCFENLGYNDVSTYINSGNVIFSTEDLVQKARIKIEECLEKRFGFKIGVVVIEASAYQKIVSEKPRWWGDDLQWKYNLIFILEPYNMKDVVAAIGKLKPGIEALYAGDGYLFQAHHFKSFGRSAFSRVVGTPVYKQMTIRNYNTATKLAQLLK